MSSLSIIKIKKLIKWWLTVDICEYNSLRYIINKYISKYRYKLLKVKREGNCTYVVHLIIKLTSSVFIYHIFFSEPSKQ